MKVYRETRTLTRTFVKWENGTKVTFKPAELVTIDLEINIDELFADLGHKAARSTGGKAVLGGGMITAKRRKDGTR